MEEEEVEEEERFLWCGKVCTLLGEARRLCLMLAVSEGSSKHGMSVRL